MICRTWGQYNYETFDGLYYYFPGKCTYTLVRECGEETDPSFVIQVHNDPECHSSAYSCSRSVSLFFPVEAELRLNRYNVTYNGQSIQLPHIVHDVEVERISQYTLVTLQHGFTLAWDGSTSSVYIKMSPEYVGRTCGLCGNFNADVHDDLKTSYDLFTHDTAIFGNSWMETVPHVYSCPSVPANYPSPCLTQNYETRQKVQEMCILLLETPFKECHDLVSPFPFMASCSNDLCIAGPDNQVLCQALTEYARACAHAERPLYDWRAAIPMCAVECDDEFIYRECITCCPVSCNVDKMCIDSKLQCLDGCYCPEGECSVTGDIHFETFDGRVYTFQATCQYILAKSRSTGKFTISLQNAPCGANLDGACIQSVNIIVDEDPMKQITVNNIGEVYVSNLYRITPPYSDTVFQIHELSSMFLQVKTEDGLRLQYNWKELRLYLQVDESWKEDTVGLCGTFNGNIQDDFLFLKHGDECFEPIACPCLWKGKEYYPGDKVTSPCHNCVCQHGSFQCIFHPCPSMCTAYGDRHYRTFDGLLFDYIGACKVYLVKVDVTWFYMNCLTDTCGCNRGGDCECFCTSVSAYAHRCCQQGITVDWRSPTVCPYDCEFYNKENPVKDVNTFLFEKGFLISKITTKLLEKNAAMAYSNTLLSPPVLGKGPFKLVTYLESETVLAAHFSGGAAFPVQGAVSIPGVAMLFMLTPGLSRSKPHDTTLVSLEAAERPNYFLHLGPNGYLRVTKWEESDQFQEASTFIIHKDTWLAGYDSFESYMKPGIFVHYMLSSIHLMKYNHSVGFRQATLFKLEEVELFLEPSVCSYLPGAVTSPSVNDTVSLGSTLSTAAPIAAARTTTETQRTSPTPTSSTEASFVMTISPKPLGPTIQTTPGNDTTESLFTTITTLAPDVTKPERAVTFSPTVSNLTLVTESLATTAKTPVTSTSIPISTSELQTTPSSPYTTRTTTGSTTASSAAGAFLQTTTTKPPEISKVTTISVVPETELLPTVDWTSSAIESPSKATTVLTSTSPRPLEETEKTTVSTAEVTGLPAYTTTSKGPTKQPGTSTVTETSSATVATTKVYIDTSTKVADKTVSPLTTKPLSSESTVYSSPFKTVKTSAYTTPETKSPLTTEAITSKSTVYSPPVKTGKTTLTSAETTPQLPTELTTSKSLGYSPPGETGKTTLTTVETKPQLSTQLTTSKSPGYSPPVETGKTTLTTVETKPQLSTQLTTSKSPGYSPPVETGKTTLTTVETKPQLSTQLTTSKSPGYSPPVETGKTTLTTVETKPQLSTQLTTSKSPGYSPPVETGKTTLTTVETKPQLSTQLTTSKSPGYSPPVETGKTTLTTVETKPQLSTQLTTSKSPGYSPPVETGKTTLTTVETKPQLSTQLTTSKSPGYSPPVETGKTTLTTVETKPQLSTQLTTSKSPGYSPPVETGKTTLTTVETKPQLSTQLTTSKSPGYSPPVETGKTTLTTVETKPQLSTQLTTSKSPGYSPPVETGKTTLTTVETKPQLSTQLTTSKSPGYSPPVETGKTTLTTVETKPQLSTQLTTSKSPGYSPPVETGKTTLTTVETKPQLSTQLTTSKSPGYSPPVETGKTTLTTVETKPQLSTQLTTSKSPGYSPPVETGKTTLTTVETKPQLSTQLTTSKSPGYSPPVETGKTTLTTVETKPQLSTQLTTSKSPGYSPPVETGKTTLTTVETKPQLSTQLTTSKSPGYSPPVETGKTTLTTVETKPQLSTQLTTSKSPGYSPPPQYSEIIDDCTKYVCMNGQLMLFNKSQNCPYNATPPNCGLLGFAILVNGDKCCPQWDCPCRCSVFPDLNIITFDGNSVAIYKAASYIVTQLPNETVSIQVQECQSSDTLLWNFTNLCLVALNITHKAHQVLIDRLQRRLYVNSRYARPRFKKNGFEILDTGNMYLIKTPAGLKIQWFHSTGMMVIETDSPSHKLTTMGLCGCCDGDPTNDLTLFNGTTVRESEDPTVFIDSWQVPNTTSFMGQNRRREVNCSTSDCSECLSMLSNQTFSSCHAFVPPKMFCEVWVRDAEYVKSPCTALAAYVAACHKFSICIEWRSPDYCCKEDGKSCQKVTVRMTIRKNDCRSNRPVNIVSCDGKCPSASIYNYNINTYARFCKCCREIGLQRRSVQLYCSGNSTWVYYPIQEPTDCSCQWS
ncbi:UNVERIFIED_CONTAM: hypothetical protein FKN15_029056 [Acipenser sinensis]